MKAAPSSRRSRVAASAPDSQEQARAVPPRGPAALLRLQRQAGNAAVSRMIQRQPLDQADDPKQYSSGKNVAFAGDGVVRREVRGLTYGLKAGKQASYSSTVRKKDKVTGVVTESTVTRPSFEKTKTKQDVEHMAVVIMPDHPVGSGPVQVILHFHGWGFRANDPYAGYTVSAEAGRKGTVRDADQEHWEQQTGAVGRERAAGQPSVVTILAQGRGMSDFGDVPTYDYIADVFSMVPELSQVQNYSLIQSGHSGGGSAVAASVGRGTAATADRARLPAAQKDRAAPQPSDMVVLFDAEGVESVTSWAVKQVEALAAIARAGGAADVRAAIAATPKLRAYFAAGGFYADRYTAMNNRLGAAIDKVPGPWGSPTSAAVSVADLFRFVEVSGRGVDHEHVISRGTAGKAEDGSVADALRASVDPTGDRGQALSWARSGRARRAKAAAPAPLPPVTAPAPMQAPAQLRAPVPAATRSTAGSTAARSTAGSTAARGWSAAGAASEYLLTKEQRDLIATQTPQERKADATAYSAGQKRLKALTSAEKEAAKAKTTLSEADAKELAGLRELQARVSATQAALKRSDVEDILKAAGHTVSDWYGEVQRGTFLNVSVRVHRNMAEALQRAEATLVADPQSNPDKLDAAALGRKLGMSPRASDMRAPKAAVGGKSISMHTFGLAVDLNYAGNPYLVLNGRTAPNVIVRATSLVTGTPVDVGTYLGDTKTAYDKLTGASGALVTYLSLRDESQRGRLKNLVATHKPASGEPTDEAGWLAQIEKDHKAITGSKDFAGHTSPEKGFVDFSEAVVMALAGAGLTWGGTYGDTKDLMHFDLRSGEGATIDSARKKHKANR